MADRFGSRLSVMLWAAFVASVAAGGFALLPACGLLLPLAVTLPGPGWNFCPTTPLALSAEAERGATLERLVHRLELKLAQENLACASIPPPPPPPLELPTHTGQSLPQQTALLKPPPPPPPPKPEPKPLDSERWNNKDLSLLNGCWQLGREGATSYGDRGSSESCRVPAGRICFGQDGTGSREMTMTCPSTGTITCTAPITAAFGSDGTLGTKQPAVTCSDGRTMWRDTLNWLTCTRSSDTLAFCRSVGFEYEFRR